MAIGAYVVGIFTVPVELRPNVFYAAPMNPLIADIQMPLWLALIAGGLLACFSGFSDRYTGIASARGLSCCGDAGLF